MANIDSIIHTVDDKKLLVHAIKDIGNFNGWNIIRDDYLVIDTTIAPETNDLVLINDDVLLWNNQNQVMGVVVYAGREIKRPS